MTPKKYPQNLQTQIFFYFSEKTLKIIEIQNFEPRKMTRAYVYMKISEYPPPPGGKTILVSKMNFQKYFTHVRLRHHS